MHRKPPVTPVNRGCERAALEEHIDKMANQLTLERVQRVAQVLAQAEKAKKRLIRIISVGALVVLLLVLAATLIYRL